MQPTTSDMSHSIDQYFSDNFAEVTDPLNRSSGKQIFVAKSKLKAFNDIMGSRNTSYSNLYIYKQLASLKGSGVVNSMFSRYTALSRMLPIEGGQILYCVWNGRVYITDIVIELNYRFDKETQNVPAGVYKVKKMDDTEKPWRAGFDKNSATLVDEINTKHLAINGHCKHIGDAANYMPAFIQYGHGESSLKDTYSLFFNPCQGFIRGDWHSLRNSTGVIGTQAAQKLAATLIVTAKKNVAVSLTVHESGHALLKEALRIVNKEQGIKLDQFTVFYANPTHNLQLVDKWRASTGMKLATKAPLVNRFSAQQFLLTGNAISAPWVAAKANPKDAGATIYNAITAGISTQGVVQIGAGLLGAAGWAAAAAPFLFGLHRGLNKQVIDTPGKSVQEGARKLIWDPIHKMMVKG